MAFSINNTNIEPNLKWFVKLSATTGVKVELFVSYTEALAGTNMIASGTTSGFGSGLEVVLTQSAPSPLITWHNAAFAWHFIVGGGSGDPIEIFKVGHFTDMDEESHAIYRNPSVIPYKASALINERTHLDRRITIQTPNIKLGLHSCDAIRLDSDELGIDWVLTGRDVAFEFTPDAMTQSITASKFERITR